MTVKSIRVSNRIAGLGLAIGIILTLVALNKAVSAPVISDSGSTEASIHGQGPGQTTLTWNFKQIEVPVAAGQLRVSLSDLYPDTDYILGVRTVEAKEATLVVGEVSFSGPPAPGRVVTGIVDWPRDRIEISPGKVHMSRLSETLGSVLIYLNVPSGTELLVQANERTVLQAAVGGSWVVRNGVSAAEEVIGIRTLVSRLTRSDQSLNTAELVRIRGDHYIATPKGLASNLVSLKRPTFPSEVAVEDIEGVTLRVTIDHEGVVREISRVSGKEQLLSAVEEAVRDWKFRGFRSGGQPVSVQASIVFFFAKDGKISSPIFNEIQK
jgi:hypothetical protein